MSVFTQPDFLAIKTLDFENKFIQPTTQLILQLQDQMKSLYLDIHQALISWHGIIAVESKKMYQAPAATYSQWYAKITGYGRDVQTTFMTDILPKAENGYQQVMVDLEHWGEQLHEFWRSFYNNPEAVATQLMEPVAANFNAAVNVSQVYLIGMYEASIDLFNLLLEQPEATLTAIYQHTLNILLSGYFELISSLLG